MLVRIKTFQLCSREKSIASSHWLIYLGQGKEKNLRINLHQFPKASVAMLILNMVNLRENDQKPNRCDF